VAASSYLGVSHFSRLRGGRAFCTALALAAAATVGALALPAPAYAQVISQVAVYGNTKADVERWGAGWDACRKDNPSTRSVKQDGDAGQTGTQGKWVAYWECFDTKDAT
jgi:hypothetical protein